MYECGLLRKFRYNSVNGVPTCTNQNTTRMLREDWEFGGYITSDSDSCADVYNTHHYTKTAEEAVNACLAGGCDIDSGATYSGHLQSAVEQGTTTRALVDAALTNSYRMRFRMGLFDPNVSTVYDNITKAVVGFVGSSVIPCIFVASRRIVHRLLLNCSVRMKTLLRVSLLLSKSLLCCATNPARLEMAPQHCHSQLVMPWV